MKLKYRAWDGTKMRTSFVIHNENGRPMITGILGGELQIQEDWIVMQWTGHIDRLRKEIYDGDIVWRRSGQRVWRAAVYQADTGAWFTSHPGGGIGWLLASNDEKEVIGDIYQTPEIADEV